MKTDDVGVSASNLLLGPLPEPHTRVSHATAQNTRSVRHGYEQGGYVRWPDMYTADQMRAYAAQEVAAERERCAKICESMHPEDGPHAYAWAIRTEWAADCEGPNAELTGGGGLPLTSG